MRCKSTSGSLGYKPEISLINLLVNEDNAVKQLNDAKYAYEIARKQSARLNEYERQIDAKLDNLDSIREKIRLYMANILGISVPVTITDEITVSKEYIKRENMIDSLYNKK